MSADGFLGDLGPRLDALAEERIRQWWERYLKGEATFRGVKMADTRRVVDDLVATHRLDVADPVEALDVAQRCFRRPPTEDKMAGVLLLSEHAIGTIGNEHVDDLAAPLASGDLADWNIVDWYCVKVLGAFVTAPPDVEYRSRSIAAWVHARALWQRRAGLVAFAGHAATEPELFPGFTDMLVGAAEVNVADPVRWSQTSVGWILREIARRRPDVVVDFLGRHPELSDEARRNARKHLS